MPSPRVILRPVLEKMKSKTTARAIIPRSRNWPIVPIVSAGIVGATVPKISAGRPSTMQILKILLPMMLPTSNSVSFFLAAAMVVTSSGSDVPKATMVSAIMRSDTPKVCAILVAEFTTSSAPPMIPARPTTTSSREIPSLNLGFSTSVAALRSLRAVEII